MQISEIVSNLYTNRKCDWIKKLDDVEISPFVIQQWLCMNDRIRTQVRWLDKYVFTLQHSPKMYLSLAWTIIPKMNKPPFVPYIKKMEQEEEYQFILERIRKHFRLSDNDYNSIKIRLLKYITKDANSMVEWFSYYGIPKKIWKKYYLDFNLMRKFGEGPKKQKGLADWGVTNG